MTTQTEVLGSVYSAAHLHRRAGDNLLDELVDAVEALIEEAYLKLTFACPSLEEWLTGKTLDDILGRGLTMIVGMAADDVANFETFGKLLERRLKGHDEIHGLNVIPLTAPGRISVVKRIYQLRFAYEPAY